MTEADPTERRAEVEAWLSVALEDRRAITACLAVDPPLRTIAAFHCQQALEKLLKGFLVLSATRFTKTHSLSRLGHAAAAVYPELAEIVGSIDDWTMWVTAYRYPSAQGIAEPEPDDGELAQALIAIDDLARRLRANNADEPMLDSEERQ